MGGKELIENLKFRPF